MILTYKYNDHLDTLCLIVKNDGRMLLEGKAYLCEAYGIVILTSAAKFHNTPGFHVYEYVQNKFSTKAEK